jgi:hypothetical protein
MSALAQLFNQLIVSGFEKFGRYYSSYRGFVVRNDDPSGYGRLQLKVPQIYGSQTFEYWAWQKNCFSGEGYGMQCIPPLGSMVYVEFEFGDPKKPIWSYGHFGKNTNGQNEKPQELENINNFWFKTPGGHLVELDDTNKVVRLTNTNGKYLEITDNGISFVSDVISLGKSGGSAEPIPLGNTLKGLLERLIDATGKLSDASGRIQVTTAWGPSGPPLNASDFTLLTQELDQVKSEFENFLSKISTTD